MCLLVMACIAALKITTTDHVTGRLTSFVQLEQRSTVPILQPVLISGSQASDKIRSQFIQRLCSRLSLMLKQ